MVLTHLRIVGLISIPVCWQDWRVYEWAGVELRWFGKFLAQFARPHMWWSILQTETPEKKKKKNVDTYATRGL